MAINPLLAAARAAYEASQSGNAEEAKKAADDFKKLAEQSQNPDAGKMEAANQQNIPTPAQIKALRDSGNTQEADRLTQVMNNATAAHGSVVAQDLLGTPQLPANYSNPLGNGYSGEPMREITTMDVNRAINSGNTALAEFLMPKVGQQMTESAITGASGATLPAERAANADAEALRSTQGMSSQDAANAVSMRQEADAAISARNVAEQQAANQVAQATPQVTDAGQPTGGISLQDAQQQAPGGGIVNQGAMGENSSFDLGSAYAGRDALTSTSGPGGSVTTNYLYDSDDPNAGANKDYAGAGSDLGRAQHGGQGLGFQEGGAGSNFADAKTLYEIATGEKQAPQDLVDFAKGIDWSAGQINSSIELPADKAANWREHLPRENASMANKDWTVPYGDLGGQEPSNQNNPVDNYAGQAAGVDPANQAAIDRVNNYDQTQVGAASTTSPGNTPGFQVTANADGTYDVYNPAAANSVTGNDGWMRGVDNQVALSILPNNSTLPAYSAGTDQSTDTQDPGGGTNVGDQGSDQGNDQYQDPDVSNQDNDAQAPGDSSGPYPTFPDADTGQYDSNYSTDQLHSSDPGQIGSQFGSHLDRVYEDAIPAGTDPLRSGEALRHDDPLVDWMLRQMQSEYRNSQDANEARYQDILTGLGDVSQQLVGEGGAYHQALMNWEAGEQSYKDMMDAALLEKKNAFDAMTGQINTASGGWQEREDKLMGYVDQYSDQSMTDLRNQYQQQQSSALQGLISSGMGNSTVAQSIGRGLTESQMADERRLGDEILGRRLDTYGKASGERLDAQGHLTSMYGQAAGDYTSAHAGYANELLGVRQAGTEKLKEYGDKVASQTYDILNVMKDRTDEGPTLNELFNLAIQGPGIAAGQGGQFGIQDASGNMTLDHGLSYAADPYSNMWAPYSLDQPFGGKPPEYGGTFAGQSWYSEPGTTNPVTGYASMPVSNPRSLRGASQRNIKSWGGGYS